MSLACGHTVCRTCLDSLQMRQCPFDSTLIGVSSLDALPVNTALLQLIGSGEVPARSPQGLCPSMCDILHPQVQSPTRRTSARGGGTVSSCTQVGLTFLKEHFLTYLQPFCSRCVEELALQLKPSVSSALSRPMQRKLVTLINCQVHSPALST